MQGISRVFLTALLAGTLSSAPVSSSPGGIASAGGEPKSGAPVASTASSSASLYIPSSTSSYSNRVDPSPALPVPNSIPSCYDMKMLDMSCIRQEFKRLREHNMHVDERFFDVYQTRLRTRPIDMIVLHVSESPKTSDLYHVGWISQNSNGHYAVGRDGVVYPILAPEFFTRHAGRAPQPQWLKWQQSAAGRSVADPPIGVESLWNGVYDVDQNSIGIEIIGMYDTKQPEPNARQIPAVKALVAYLMERFHVPADRVLGHNQVAFEPTTFNQKTGMPVFGFRGRKQDPGSSFPWGKLGLPNNYKLSDPDIIAGHAGLHVNLLSKSTPGQLASYCIAHPGAKFPSAGAKDTAAKAKPATKNRGTQKKRRA